MARETQAQLRARLEMEAAENARLRNELEEENRNYNNEWEFPCANMRVSFASKQSHDCRGCARKLPERSLHIRVADHAGAFYGDHYCWPCAIRTFGPAGPIPTVWMGKDERGAPTGHHEHGAGCIEPRTGH